MLNIFQPKEDKRIKELYLIYKKQIDQGINNDEALMAVWGELKTRATPLKESCNFNERTLESKQKLITELFSLDVPKYDIISTIRFIIAWEFPKKYNRSVSIEEIRSGKDWMSVLENKINKIIDNI